MLVRNAGRARSAADEKMDQVIAMLRGALPPTRQNSARSPLGRAAWPAPRFVLGSRFVKGAPCAVVKARAARERSQAGLMTACARSRVGEG